MNVSEIANSLKNNKLRTALTGFSIAWGIILLVVMLGAGDGVEKGIRSTLDIFGASQMQMELSLNTTEKAYAGYAKGRELYLLDNQLQYLRESNRHNVYAIDPVIEKFTEVKTPFGTSNVQLVTMTPSQQKFNKRRIISGRLFTPQEHENSERVAIISEGEVSKLFKANQNPLGQNIIISGMSFKVIGVSELGNPFLGLIYTPYSTFEGAYPNQTIHIKKLIIFPKATKTSEILTFQKGLDKQVKTMLKVDPEDGWGVDLNSSSDMENNMQKIFTGLQILLWILGIGSLSIGTIGVSNIMSVTVQERMREIGIRKAIGAKPKDILQLILGESLLLSLVSGSIGIVLGYGIIELIDYLVAVNHWAEQTFPMGPSGEFPTFVIFQDPNVNIGVAIGALIVLIFAGLIAGFAPALKAIRIPAITAMRDTK